MLSGLLYQRTIPDSALGWPSPGWARRRPDQREAEEGDPGEGGRDSPPGDYLNIGSFLGTLSILDLNIKSKFSCLVFPRETLPQPL